MENHKPNSELSPIPAKRYFTIGEVSELCGVKAHVLRYWEQEFTQLKPVKRSGNRRYYQQHEVLLVRPIPPPPYLTPLPLTPVPHLPQAGEEYRWFAARDLYD